MRERGRQTQRKRKRERGGGGGGAGGREYVVQRNTIMVFIILEVSRA